MHKKSILFNKGDTVTIAIDKPVVLRYQIELECKSLVFEVTSLDLGIFWHSKFINWAFWGQNDPRWTNKCSDGHSREK